jgi:hypothetical protein
MDPEAPHRRGRGRPALPADKGKRYPLGIRTTRELKNLLQEEADASGRSMAQEIEFRLERSVHADRQSAMFGRAPLALAEIITLAMLKAGDVAMGIAHGGEQSFGGDWTQDAYAFAQAERAVQTVFDALRPAGSTSMPGHSADYGSSVGETLAKRLIDALAASDCPSELGQWARWPREWLGLAAIERLKKTSANKKVSS